MAVYLDYNATTPICSEVRSAISQAMDAFWGNPSSDYQLGKQARQEIEKARGHLARLINANSTEIVFTSGGTESNCSVFNAILEHYDSNSKNESPLSFVPHFICSAIEHDSVMLPLKKLKHAGKIQLTELQICSGTGKVSCKELLRNLRSNTRLVSIMLANNETGVIQPIRQLSQTVQAWHSAHRHESRFERILFHTDAAQAIGKYRVDLQELGDIDYLTIVGHKFYGPRIAALFVRGLSESGVPMKTVPYCSLLQGGRQERGLRAGTENTPLIVGLGEAARLVSEHLQDFSNRMQLVRDTFEKRISEHFGTDVKFLSKFPENCEEDVVHRLPNTSSISFWKCGLSGRRIIELCRDVFSASEGAACHTAQQQMKDDAKSSYSGSEILKRSGIDEKFAKSAVRFSVGRETSITQIIIVANTIKEKIMQMKITE